MLCQPGFNKFLMTELLTGFSLQQFLLLYNKENDSFY